VIIEFFSLGVTAEALRTNIDWKSAFLKGVGYFETKFYMKADVPHPTTFRVGKLDASTISMHQYVRR